MPMTRLKLTMPLYVIDCDLKVIVDEITTPCDKVYIGDIKAKKKADEYARMTGHSVCVVKPTSWH